MQAGCTHFAFVAVVWLGLAVSRAGADEGFWLFNDPPRKLLKERYKYELTDEWLERVRKSPLLVGDGGSASFVTSSGLVSTNLHVVGSSLQDLTTGERNIIRDGFLARTRHEEIRCPDVSLSVLVGIEDVTKRVQQAVKPGMKPHEAYTARNKAMKAVERDCKTKTGLWGTVASIYDGEYFHLYSYKVYHDVRLVFAPETRVISAFDVCFLRAYENDRPVKPEGYIPWSVRPVPDGSLAFIAGNPSPTWRHRTVAELEGMRETYEYEEKWVRRRLELLAAYRRDNAKAGEEIELEYFKAQHAVDHVSAMLEYLGPGSEIMGRKRGAEIALRTAIEKNPGAREMSHGAWERLSEALATYNKLQRKCTLGGTLAYFAYWIVQAADRAEEEAGEEAAPETAAEIDARQRDRLRPVRINKELETLKLTDSLTRLVAEVGASEELVRKIMAGKTPKQRAIELVEGTTVGDPKARKELFDGGKEAVSKSKDPLIGVVRLLVTEGKKRTKEASESASEIAFQEKLRIMRAVRMVDGPRAYPDANYLLRLSFGRIHLPEVSNEYATGFSRIRDVFDYFEKSAAKPLVGLPETWASRRDTIDLRCPFSVTGDCDGHSGNSGSPVLDRNGTLIAVLMGGAAESRRTTFEYDEKHSRFLAISTASITEILKKIYNAVELVTELTEKAAKKAN